LKKIVIDACTYSNFVRTKSFWILERLFKNRLTMTYLVKKEIEKGFGNYPQLRVLNTHIEEGFIEIISELSEQELSLMTNLPRGLSDADKSCISVANGRKAIIASDDENVIKEAKKFGISLIDTVEIIFMAVQKGLLECSIGNEILDKMGKEANFQTKIRLNCDRLKEKQK